MKLANAFRWLILPLLMMSMTACGMVNSSSAVSPDLVDYSPAFQLKALEERRALPQVAPCHPVEPSKDCSALKQMVNDYATLRRQIRAQLAN